MKKSVKKRNEIYMCNINLFCSYDISFPHVNVFLAYNVKIPRPI